MLQIDAPRRKFLAMPLSLTQFLEIPKFPYNTVWDRWNGRKPTRQNLLDSFSRFDTIPACDRRTDGRTHDDSKLYRATIANIVSFYPRDAKLARVLDPVYVCLTPCQFSIEKVKRIGLGFSIPTLCYKEI